MITASIKHHFLLRQDITYLNFGAFGACPRPVFDAYQHYQLLLEHEPTQFLLETGPKLLAESRIALAQYLSCDADDVVYVTNPSYAVNIIAKSLDLKPGDEVLSTNLEYGACDRTWAYYCIKKGAKYIQQHIQLPIASKQDFINQFFSGVSGKTKLIFISQITSATGLRLPVEEICAIAKAKGIITFIDGAHAVGQLDINLSTLQADIYTGACHKWMLAPKGASFLYVQKNLQHLFDPLLISWGYNSLNPSHSQFLDYHQMQGTRDYAAFLAVPAAIQFLEEHDWKERSRVARAITQNNAERFCQLLNATPLCPIDSDFVPQMMSIPLNIPYVASLHDVLYNEYKIQIPVMKSDDNYYLRYSVQAFNSQADLDKLYNALKVILSV